MSSDRKKMIAILLLLTAITMATLGAQASNYIAIKLYQPETPYWSMLKAAFFLIPVSVLSTFLFNIYFSQGYPVFSYSSLNIIAVGAAIFIGFVIEQILKTKSINIYEVTGNIIIIAGIAIVILLGKGE